jgi:hypothetical protein
LKLFATDVFTPNAFPEHTYVVRDGERLERELRQALQTPKVVVSISGPSKSGKTVLIEKVVGLDNLILVSGIEIESGDDLWTNTLAWMDVPTTTAVQSTSATTNQVAGEVGGKGSIFFAETTGKASYQRAAVTGEN